MKEGALIPSKHDIQEWTQKEPKVGIKDIYKNVEKEKCVRVLST